MSLKNTSFNCAIREHITTIVINNFDDNNLGMIELNFIRTEYTEKRCYKVGMLEDVSGGRCGWWRGGG